MIIHVLCPEHAQMVDEFGTAEPLAGAATTRSRSGGEQPSDP
jgi:hypothetical protein